MKTKHALILGISIIIGSMIDPLLKKSFSKPNKSWIRVFSGNGSTMPVKIDENWDEWKLSSSGMWERGNLIVADIESAKILSELHGN